MFDLSVIDVLEDDGHADVLAAVDVGFITEFLSPFFSAVPPEELHTRVVQLTCAISGHEQHGPASRRRR